MRWPSRCVRSGWLVGVVSVAAILTASPARAAGANWQPEVFDYNRPTRLNVTDKGEPKDNIPGTRQQELTFTNLRGEEVPVLITLPPKGKGPFAAVLLVHPLGGDRRQVTVEMAKSLTTKGFACVALDLPKHGSRAEKNGKGEDLFLPEDPDQTYKNIVGAVMDIRQTIDLLKERKDLDIEKGVPVIGYSMGAWFGTVAGSADRRVQMLVLMGGSAHTGATSESKGLFKIFKSEQKLFEKFPTIRPEVAIAEFGPRPLLMQNGKRDPFVTEENARDLYRKAKAPKELKWYDCGHILPEQAMIDAAEWVAKNR